MRSDKRKSLLLQEWDSWLQTRPTRPPAPTARESLQFFYELEEKHSPLVAFRPRQQDRWRVIHCLLLNEGRVFDDGQSRADIAIRQKRTP